MEKHNIPHHIAFIMDGNRRWAKKKRLPVFAGHRQGESCVEPLIDEAIIMGVKYLTFWAFSTENWKREKREVNYLMSLCRRVLSGRINRFHEKHVKLNIIGNRSLLPKDIVKSTDSWMEKTRNNRKITVNIALSYGGRDEIIRAVNTCKDRSGKRPDNLTQDDLGKFLDTYSQPDPDLLIRTGGEMRLSGFMLWQIEYTELYFTPILWPDFKPENLREAVEEYNIRRRSYGK